MQPNQDPNTSRSALDAQNTLMRALRERLGLGSAQGLLGVGMAQGAAQSMQAAPAYKAYAESEIAAGRQPMPVQQWMQQQGGQRQQGY